MSPEHKQLCDVVDNVIDQLGLISALAGEHNNLHLVTGRELSCMLESLINQLKVSERG